jgi:hypothetical protein
MCINLFSRLKVTFETLLQYYNGIIWNLITDNNIKKLIRLKEFNIVLCVCMCVRACVCYMIMWIIGNR